MIRTTSVTPNALGRSRIEAARGTVPSPVLSTIWPGTNPDPLPLAVDNSTLPYFPPIRGQGDINSCVSFSNSYYVLTYMTAMAHGWNVKDDADNTNKFSPKMGFNLTNNGVNEGGPSIFIFRYLLQHGGMTWANNPYIGDRSNALNYRAWPVGASVWRDAITYRPAQIGYVPGVDTDQGLSLVKQLLNNGYVLNVGTHMQHWTYKKVLNDTGTALDASAIGKDCAYWCTNDVEGHSMTLVGYNDEIWVDINGDGKIDLGEKGALRIANSAGPNWVPSTMADGGYVWLSYDAVRAETHVPGKPDELVRIPTIYMNEAYWMNAQPAYTPKLLAQFTLSHARRNQLKVTLGASDASGTTPSVTLEHGALQNQGGPYAFNGTTTACDGEFVFDCTDLLNTVGSPPQRWYLGVTDNAAGYPAEVLSFKLIDVANGEREIVATGVPVQVDNATRYLAIDYTPVAQRQPDLLIRAASEATSVGDNVYNAVEAQTRTQRIASGRTAVYHVTIQNDGTGADDLLLVGTVEDANWRIRYFNNTTGEEITMLVTGAGWPINGIASGTDAFVRIEVSPTVTVTPPTNHEVTMTVVSQGDATKSDTVMATTEVAAPLTVVALSALPISPQPVGTAVTLSATATGGCNLVYQFAYQSGDQWITLRDFTSESTFPWTPSTSGSYTLGVFAREADETEATIHATLSYQVQPQTMATLGDLAWHDLNGNGLQEAGEPGLAGVRVRLYTGTTLVATTTTDTQGKYRFTNLAAGSYQVQFAVPRGFVVSPRDKGGNDAQDSDIDPLTGKAAALKLAAGATNLKRDAGFHDPSASVVSSQQGTLGSAPIPAGSSLWFSASARVYDTAGTPASLFILNATIRYTVNGVEQAQPAPDTVVYFASSVKSASTTFDAFSNRWVIKVPANFGSDVFLGGVAIPVTAALPGNLSPVTWSGTFATDSPRISLRWTWRGGAYSTFSTDYGALKVKPVDGNRSNPYKNNDKAGTPEAFKNALIPNTQRSVGVYVDVP